MKTSAAQLAIPEKQGPWLLSPAARPLRFIGASISSAAVQILVLDALTDLGWTALWSNVVAILIASQVNFALNSLITWHDHPPPSPGSLSWRWLRFIAILSSTMVLNQGVFLLALRWLPIFVASLGASALISGLNYLLGGRFIFLEPAPA